MGKDRKISVPMANMVLLIVAFSSLAAFVMILEGPKDRDPWHGLDTSVNEWAAGIQGGPLDGAAKFIGVAFNPIILAIVLSFQFSCFRFKDFRKDTIFFSLTLFLSAVLVEAIKVAVHRPRPTDMIVGDVGYSFPSGHATMAIVLFGLLLYISFKRLSSRTLKVAAVSLSLVAVVLVGLDRVYLNAHWMSDVVGGYALGTFLLATALLIKNVAEARAAARRKTTET